ncbi:MAG: CHAT domain-containing protein [Parafilimonas sp.]|nr:CHAT domain-containing protein [Parafilimonas sp.]
MKKLCFCLIGCFIYFSLFSQTETKNFLFEQIQNFDYQNPKPSVEKLKFFYALKNKIEGNKPLNDSAYILVLLKISKYEFLARNNYESSIKYADAALDICNKLKKENFKFLKVNACYNLASSYQKLTGYRKALTYYDSVIFLCNTNFIDSNYYQLDALYNKVDIYFFLGDYQRTIEESINGVNLSTINNDSSYYIYFLNRKIQSLYYEGYLKQAFANSLMAISIAQALNNWYELATAYKTLGFICEKNTHLDSADYFFKQSIHIRIRTKKYEQITKDYIDLGNFYLNSKADFNSAIYYYKQSLVYASKIEFSADRNLAFAQATINLGETNLIQKKLQQATDFFLKSFSNFQINLRNDIKQNPSTIQLSKIANKDPVIILMNDKTNLLLQLYNSNHDNSYLTACIQSAIVTDSVITQIRHEQSGEQSKLYWRDKTRDFYSTALEASYLVNKPDLAFYFMEKSRAVLLNDKLNELNASSYLSKTDAAKQENYEIKIVELEQKLSSSNDTSKQYQAIQLQYLSIKNEFEQFIKSLEQKYPAYYQYKYADEVPSLQNLQQYLAKNHQSFVHYFLGDTVTYILAITPTQTKIVRLTQSEFDKDQLSQFLQLCANKETLNNHYDRFAQLSNSIYKKIFQQLQLPKSRVVICTDNIVIPFDALCTDASGRNFLLHDYSFSYVYSARFLMKQFNNPSAQGNFVGFAPVSFAKYLDVNDLKNAADALHASASYYGNDKLFTHQNATRKNFFKYVSSYSIVSVFSHARADTSDDEPVLYMQDSLIHLSELQLLNDPATKLVLLSACQTNVGRNATGEGIYSLARGFATAGIPCVAATLWKADEQTIYSISEKFNEYLAEGMTKDEALQKAKLFFIQGNSSEKLLPYYWANMIVIGNTDGIKLINGTSSISVWHFIYFCISLSVVLIFIYTNRKIKKS